MPKRTELSSKPVAVPKEPAGTEPVKNEVKSTPASKANELVQARGDAFSAKPVTPPKVPEAKEGFVPLATIPLGEAPTFQELFGVPLQKLAENPSKELLEAIHRVAELYAKTAPKLSEADRAYLKSHLTDFIKVFAKLERWLPAIVVFGTARSKPAGTPNADPIHVQLYENTRQLAKQIARLGVPERDGAGPGAMKAAGEGFIEGRNAILRGELAPFPPDDTPNRTTGISEHADWGALKAQGVKIELNPNEITFEQNVESDNEDHVTSENFLARKVGLWLNALMTIVDEGGFGTTEELLEVAAMIEEGFVNDPLVIKNGSVWASFVDALKQHSVARPETLNAIRRIDRDEQIADVFREKDRVGFERPPAEIFESLTRDIIHGVEKLSKFPPGVTVLGAETYPAGSPARARIEELAAILTRAGVPIRTTGAHDTAEAICKGIRGAGGDPQNVQLFPYRGDEPQKIDRLKADHFFENFIIQKELISRESRPMVLDTPDIRSISILFSELTQVQTKEHAPKPIILMGKKEWEPILASVVEPMLKMKTISPGDDKLFKIVDTPQEAAKIVLDFIKEQQGGTKAAAGA